MKTSIILPVVCFVAGIGVGAFFLKRPDAGQSASAAVEPQGNTLRADAGDAGSGGMSATSGGGSKPAGGRSISVESFLDLFEGRGNGTKAYGVLATMDANTMLALLTELHDPSMTDRRQWSAQNMLLSRYAEVDPEGAMNFAVSISSAQKRRNAIGSVMGAVAAKDFQKGILFFQSLDNQQDKQYAASVMAGAGEPEEVLALLKREGMESLVGWSYNELFARFVEKDPQGAMAKFGKLPFGETRRNALQGIAASMALTDPDAGLAWASSLSTGGERWQATSAIISSLSGKDPLRAIALLDEQANPQQKKELLRTIATTWAGNDPTAARAWMETLPESARMEALSGSIHSFLEDPVWVAKMLDGMPTTGRSTNVSHYLASRWAQTDPTAAAKWVDGLPAGRAQQNARSSLVSTWAQSDPEAAARYLSADPTNGDANAFQNVASKWIIQDSDATLSWVEGLEISDKTRNEVVRNLLGTWVQQDPDAAADYALRLEGDNQKQAIDQLTSSWASQDVDTALAWVRNLDDPKLRDSALANVVQNISYNDPDRAGALLMEMARGTVAEEQMDSFKNSAQNIARQMADYNPAAAVQWVSQLPDNMGRPEAMQQVVSTWAQYEPMAASEWVSTFQDGPERDSAVYGLVNSINSDDPESAFIWAMSIGNESTRGNAVSSAVRSWENTDRDAARAAVSTSGLDDATKQRLLKSLEE